MNRITKHTAIETALLLNSDGSLRTHLVGLVNKAFANNTQLEMDTLCRRLETLSKDASGEVLVALLHYMTCMRVENIDPHC
jgi:hypothetical protein